ncbi:MAG: cation:proton antiporter [Alphaproteobacteria bacterium]|nr:cation:proton antiporter [Alphaproteobacteria bacterium]
MASYHPRMSDLLNQISSIEPDIMGVFGLLLLCGILGGILSSRIGWLPTITAFMLVGFIFGPDGAGIISKKMLSHSSFLIDIALGLILYRLGTMLHPLQIIRSTKLTVTSLAEAGLTFLGVSAIVAAFGYSTTAAMLIGAIAISSSPAVLVHVAEEMGAAGPVTDRAESLVALNNIFSFLLFTMILPFAISGTEVSLLGAFSISLYRMVSAALIGLCMAWVAMRIARLLKKSEEHYRFTIIIGALMLTLGISNMLYASMLFSALALGIATRWFEHRHSKLSNVSLGEGADLFLIILFVTAGAKTDINALLMAGSLPFILVLVRVAAKFTGVFATNPLAGYSAREATATSLLLIPMAGMAIGLVSTLSSLAPNMDDGGQTSAIVFGMVIIFETIGPFAAVKAFVMSGEAWKTFPKEEKEDHPQKQG